MTERLAGRACAVASLESGCGPLQRLTSFLVVGETQSERP
jgi:hypothetical protein